MLRLFLSSLDFGNNTYYYLSKNCVEKLQTLNYLYSIGKALFKKKLNVWTTSFGQSTKVPMEQWSQQPSKLVGVECPNWKIRL